MTDTLQAIARHLAQAFRPLEEGFRDAEAFRRLMFKLGWNPVDLPPAYSAVADDTIDVVAAAEALADGATLTEIFDVIRAAGELVSSISGLTQAPGGVDPAVFLAEIPERLVELLLVEYLARELPHLRAFFEMSGVIVFEDHPAVGDRPGWTRTRLLYEEIPKILTAPQDLPRRIYGWGTEDIKFSLLAEHLQEILNALGLHAGIGSVDPLLDRGLLAGQGDRAPESMLSVALSEVVIGDTVHPLGLSLVELPPVPPDMLAGLAILPLVPAQIGATLPLTETLAIEVRAGTDLTRQIALLLRPNAAQMLLPFDSSLPPPSVGFGATLRYHPAAPVAIFGRSNGSRLELAGAAASLDFRLQGPDVEVKIGGELEALAVVISPKDMDAFLREVIGEQDIRAELPLRIGWSNRTGLDFAAALGLEVSLRPHLELGPLTIEGLDLRLKIEGGVGLPPAIALRTTVDLLLALGPLVAAASGIGIELALTFERGNAGPFDIDYRFVPPNGIGLSMKTDMITLGGFVKLDVENGFYAGAVEISIKDVFTLSAIGLINAPIPGKDSGFSLLFIVSMVFPVPIHIAYNFYFTGVGGILGLHRSADLDRLRSGVRTGTIDDILFPEDVVRNMDRIITDLSAVFPPVEDQFVVGPMARITWSVPPLITGDFGLIVEFPDPVRVAIFGVVKAAIPTEEEAVIQIKIAFLGTIDFARGLLTFDASIYDSFIGFEAFKLTLEGDLALRISWGEKPDFALTIGGFHPTYRPPAHLLLNDVRRVKISLMRDNPRISLSCYFAITTNTIQFGAQLDFYFGISEFSVVGLLGFDVLFQFSPFRLLANIRAMVAVRMGSSELFCISLELELEGPTPWIARGSARFSILFFTIKVRVEVTVGEERTVNLPDVVVLPKLVEAFERDEAWRGLLTDGATSAVVYEAIELPLGQVLVDAGGALTIEQNVVPLDTELTRFGNAVPSDISRASVHAVTFGGVTSATEATTEPFAPATFQTLSDADKLSSPAYEQRTSGVTARSTNPLATDLIIGHAVEYERLVQDVEAPAGASAPTRGKVTASRAAFETLAQGGAVGRAARARLRTPALERGKIARLGVKEERFAVVDAEGLALVDSESDVLSRSDAEARLKDLVRRGREKKSLEIVPAHQAVR
jgi:hypothetical protein